MTATDNTFQSQSLILNTIYWYNYCLILGTDPHFQRICFPIRLQNYRITIWRQILSTYISTADTSVCLHFPYYRNSKNIWFITALKTRLNCVHLWVNISYVTLTSTLGWQTIWSLVSLCSISQTSSYSLISREKRKSMERLSISWIFWICPHFQEITSNSKWFIRIQNS